MKSAAYFGSLKDLHLLTITHEKEKVSLILNGAIYLKNI